MIAATRAAASSRPVGLAQAEAFRLGELEVRPPTREVIGLDCSILLEPRVMQVLVLLAARRGKVVSRSVLTEHCWAGQVVGDDAINRCIQAIRRLAERCGGFSIRTVARVGYRLDEEARGGEVTPLAMHDAGPQASSAHARERRRLTILSCSPVLPLGTVPDLEVRYDILRQWRQMVGDCAAPFGAFLDNGRGERILACFGYPDALEDAGERAVRAGLAIVDGIGPLNDRLRQDHGVELTLRVGIHADEAVIGCRPDGGVELFGVALDRAIALEERAQPASVAMTDEIRDSVPGRFVIETVDGQEPGSGGAMHIARSAGLAGERRPVERSAFVGRQEELGLLAGRWRRVQGGAGQLVLIHGEPGIGKSRLIEAFRDTIASESHLWIECRGEQLFSNTPLHASTQMLLQGLGWRGDESPEDRSATLERAIERSGIGQAEAFPLLTAMLGLPLPEKLPPLLLSPEQRRRRLLATLADWLVSGCRFQPLVLVVEDLHWLDPSSLELLHTLAEQGVCHPLMLLCTARPEFHSPWPARSHHLQLALGGLLPREISMLVGDVAAPHPLSADVADAIVVRADGVPLFAEALARLVRDGEGASEIPATLMDSLAARLDRIGGAREVAVIGAVIGRSFTWGLLRQLTPVRDEELQLSLERLVDAGLIQTEGTALDPHYRFRHALVCEAAYGQLLTSRRRDLHRRVAVALAAQRVAPKPEEIAQHWARAGCLEQAVGAWVEAGGSAYRRHAFAEAASGYRHALDLLAALPESAQRDAQEMTYSAAYSLALIPTAGIRSPEVIRLAARNHELAQRSGDIGRLVTARTYAFLAAMFSSEWVEASHLAQQVLSLVSGEPSQLPPVTRAYGRAMGHYCHYTAALYRGELCEAERHFRKWDALNRVREYDERAVITIAYSNAAILAWQLGDEAEAERRMEEARAHAFAIDSPFDQCTCLMIGALLNVFRGDPKAVEDLASASVKLARECSFAQVEGWAGAALGWAKAKLGSPAEGIAIVRSSLALLAKGDTRVSLPFFLTMLAEAQAIGGDSDGALASFEEALSVCPPERLYRPHTLTCLGEHLATLGRWDQAEAVFREAIATAEMMAAKAGKERAAAEFKKAGRARRTAATGPV